MNALTDVDRHGQRVTLWKCLNFGVDAIPDMDP